MIKWFACAFALALTAAAFAGSAYGGNGHGNGNGNGDASSAAAVSPGKSENAPGQEKKEAESGGPASAEAVTADESSANDDGVKPSNVTEHETHAAASSNETKKYGNGKTAGQIAIHNGAAPSTMLHGPGNSQPHKAAGCQGGHEVDVHALKARGHLKACGTTPPTHDSTPGTTPSVEHGSDPKADPAGSPSNPVGEVAGVTSTPTSTPGSSVAGTQHGGVLATARLVGNETLPFTGFPLWAIALAAVVLISVGTALRLRGREAL